MTTTALAEEFMKLFSGSATTYGTYDLTNPIVEDNGKVRGRGLTRKGSLTLKHFEDHLEGKGVGFGIVPIQDDNTCVFGAIDIDDYTLDHRALYQKLKQNKIPLIVCRTKSGGAHLYCFTKVPVMAASMKSKLSEIAAFIGLGGSEIFPKQAQVLIERGDAGNWINIPYWQGVRGLRYAIDADNNALSPEAFVLAAKSLAVDTKWFSELLVVNKDFEDGPPCLQALAQVGYPPGTRNDGLVAIGVYLKKILPDAWEAALDVANHQYMQPPLSLTEVQGVVKSLKRKDYSYACSKQPIAQFCNSALCRTRKWGVGSGSGGKFPSLGGLSKLATNPPIWWWEVDNIRIELSTEELQDPRKFQKKCADYLNVWVTAPNRIAWDTAVTVAMQNVNIIEAPPDASPEGQLWEYIEKFLTGRAQAMTIEEITMGKPFTEDDRTIFRMQDLLAFLNRQKFFEFKGPKIAAILKDSGAEHGFKNLRGKGTNYWSIKEFSKPTSGFSVPKEAGGTEAPF